MLLYQTLLICFFFIELVPKSNISVFRPVSFQVRAGSPDRGPMVGEDILTKSTKKLHENCENSAFLGKKIGGTSQFMEGMMMMMMNCGMVDRRKAFSLISSKDHCQRSSPSRISDTQRAG